MLLVLAEGKMSSETYNYMNTRRNINCNCSNCNVNIANLSFYVSELLDSQHDLISVLLETLMTFRKYIKIYIFFLRLKKQYLQIITCRILFWIQRWQTCSTNKTCEEKGRGGGGRGGLEWFKLWRIFWIRWFSFQQSKYNWFFFFSDKDINILIMLGSLR